MTEALVGVRPLLRVTLRQDARNIAPWIALITGLSASSVIAYEFLFDDPRSRAELATTLGANPALSLIFGPARNLMTSDGFNAWRAGALGGFFAALMAIFIVIRNSRADEDSGQAELLASGVLSRQARLAVALGLAVLASTVLGVVAWAVTVLCGGGVADTAVLAATFTASGWMFAGAAAVTAQVGSDARTATSIAVTVLGAAFIVRGYIDASGAGNWATWFTPLGWLEQTRPAAGNRPWPLLPAVALAVLLAVAAFALQARRDFGQGMIAARPGPARGGWAASVWGLALRLNRGSLISWIIGFAVIGTVFGFLTTSVGQVIASNPAMARILAAGAASRSELVFAFLVTIASLVGIMAAVFGVQIVLRVYAEEVEYRVEPLLAASLPRCRYLASSAVLAFAGPAVAMLVAGAVIGVVASNGDGSIAFGDVVLQSIAAIPAVWTLIALALAAVGVRPAVRLAGWLGVVATFALTLLGPTFRLPDWALGISPFWHVPNVTVASPNWSGLAWVALVAVGLTAVGFVGFRRRDVI